MWGQHLISGSNFRYLGARKLSLDSVKCFIIANSNVLVVAQSNSAQGECQELISVAK